MLLPDSRHCRPFGSLATKVCLRPQKSAADRVSHDATNQPKEIGRAPASLIAVARFAPERMSMPVILERLSRSGEGPGPSPREAAAAVATAKLLGWIDYATQ